MRFGLQLSNLLQALALFGSIVAASAPLNALADESGVTSRHEMKANNANHFSDKPCGVNSLRGERGLSGGLDLIGAWHCMRNVVMPAGYSDNNTKTPRPGHDRLNGFKLGVSARHDRVTLSVGVKW